VPHWAALPYAAAPHCVPHNRLLDLAAEACARHGAAGVVEREQPLYQQLQVPKTLQCEEDGRRCKFRDLLPAAEPTGG